MYISTILVIETNSNDTSEKFADVKNRRKDILGERYISADCELGTVYIAFVKSVVERVSGLMVIPSRV